MPSEVSNELPTKESLQQVLDSRSLEQLTKVKSNIQLIVDKLETQQKEQLSKEVLGSIESSRHFLTSSQSDLIDNNYKLERLLELESSYTDSFEQKSDAIATYKEQLGDVLADIINISSYTEKLNAGELNLSELTKQQAVLSARKKAVLVSIETAEKDYDKADDSCNIIEEQCDFLQSKLDKKSAKLTLVKDEILNLNNLKFELEFSIQTTEDDLLNAQGHGQDVCQSQLTRFTSRLNSVQLELETYQARELKLNSNIQELNVSLAQEKIKFDSSKQDCTNSEDFWNECEQKSEELDEHIKNNKSEISKLNKKTSIITENFEQHSEYLFEDIDSAHELSSALSSKIKEHFLSVTNCSQFTYENSAGLADRVVSSLYSLMPSFGAVVTAEQQMSEENDNTEIEKQSVRL